MGDTFEELKKRTNKDIFDSDEDHSLNLGLNLGSKDHTPKVIIPNSNPIPDPPINTNPNPYEEKFHSEFSFIALILGIFGLILPLFSPLAIIFGIGGLMQTHRERMKGRWMALAGIILGFIGIIVMIIAIIFSVNFLSDYLLRMGGIETLIGKVGD